MLGNKKKYYCPLVDKEVSVFEGSVITGNGIKIPQRGCNNERHCTYFHDKRCFSTTPR